MADFVDGVEYSCAFEGIAFDNDPFNELVGERRFLKAYLQYKFLAFT
jgi:hypothetical protein